LEREKEVLLRQKPEKICIDHLKITQTAGRKKQGKAEEGRPRQTSEIKGNTDLRKIEAQNPHAQVAQQIVN